MLLHHDYEASVSRRPEKAALICGADRNTYADVNRHANAIAAALRAAGVQRGDRVALFLDNGIEFVAGVYGALNIGAAFMPINPLTQDDKLADARAGALLTSEALASVWVPALARVPCVQSMFVSGQVCDPSDTRVSPWPMPDCSGARAFTAPATIDQDLANIIYTSGSTGFPKGAMVTHLNMVSAVRSVSIYLGLRDSDVVMCALPLAFDYGLYQVLMGFRSGATIVLDRNFSFPVKALENMAACRVTVFPDVPTMFAMLMAVKDLVRVDLSGLRLIKNTSAALSEAHIRELRVLFPQVTLFSMYGLTECKRVTYLPPEQLDIRPTSVGRDMPNEEVWLVDDAGGPTAERVDR